MTQHDNTDEKMEVIIDNGNSLHPLSMVDEKNVSIQLVKYSKNFINLIFLFL